MICSNCQKPIAEADPHYLEEGPDGNLFPKYWFDLGNNRREAFCSPACSTAWHAVSKHLFVKEVVEETKKKKKR